ncbi:MAG: 1-deoxy-D-xylulose-5-phosphate synthase [Firmicutes bacterium]|nr:1-deoxy-D-xylulose-5-phosphate synthase [Bacillota bacterium]
MAQSLLQQIQQPDDVKKIPEEELPALCEEIRTKLIETVAENGGHLSSNLGVVELTVALYRVFSFPEDQLVWDVGHQCYTHKLFTGRRESFSTLRKEGGISGFPNRAESPLDIFSTGHSSTSIASALGLACANEIAGKKDCHVVSVIGDGALSGGLAYEGLNNAGRYRRNFTVILNDNKMSINRNVGAMARYLAVIRTKNGYRNVKNGLESFLKHIPVVGSSLRNALARAKGMLKNTIYHSNIFEEMGFHYIGPIDGHDIATLERALMIARDADYPVLIHACTVKGKGYSFAEKNPRVFHGIGSFDVDTGEKQLSGDGYSDVFGQELCAIAEKDPTVCAITAAMKAGTGLTQFARSFPGRFYDVGIAEECAIPFAAGLAANGMKPVFAVYSTFLQRAYDQLIHDAALQNLRIVLAVDRAGFVGDDGATHQGLFDPAFLNSIPGLTVYAPTYFDELRRMLQKAIYEGSGPAAVRYPRGVEPQKPQKLALSGGENDFDLIPGAEASVLLVTYGRLFAECLRAAGLLAQRGIAVSLLKLNCIRPVPQQAVEKAAEYPNVFFAEESVAAGGVGEHFLRLLTEQGFSGKFRLSAVQDRFVAHASERRQMEQNGLDAESVADIITMECSH